MKCVFVLLLPLLLLACTEPSPGTNDNNPSASCSCEEKQDTDTVFFATKVTLEEVGGKKIIHYNCAAIEVAIASVSDESGMERCENLYELQCVSAVKNSLVLSDSFTYFTEAMDTMKIVPADVQRLFFEVLKRKETAYFQFTVVSKELKAISKIELQ